jgi:hypothetical protein
MSLGLYDLYFSGTSLFSDGCWYCSLLLCGCYLNSQQSFIAHIGKDGHVSKLSTFKLRERTELKAGRTFLARFDLVSNIKRRASELFETWENRVLAQLFHYMAGDIDGSTDTYQHLREAERLLERYERMERFALLELAVWKMTCTRHAGEVKVDPKNVRTVEDAMRFAEKQRTAWKGYKTEMRYSNAIEIIMSQVIPFVGKQ